MAKKNKSKDKVGELYELALAGDVAARMLCIQMELMGSNASPLALKWLEDMANDGDFMARMYYLEYMARTKSRECNWAKMELWCHNTLAEDPTIGHKMFSLLYASDVSGRQDMDKSLEHLQKAADAGDEVSCLKLAHIYAEALEDEHDVSEIRELLERTELEGLSDETWELLVDSCIKQGDYEAAVKYVRKWLREIPDSVEGNFRMAHLYATGNGVRKDYVNALKYYQKVANLGDSRGMHYVGIINYNGDGCRPNYKRAVDYFTRAANAGSTRSLRCLAECYLKGLGVTADVDKAVKFARIGVDLKVPECAELLAVIYFDQELGRKNLPQALEYVKLAIKYALNSDDLTDIEKMFELESEIKREIRAEELKVSLPHFYEKFERAFCGGTEEMVNEVMLEAVEKYADVQRVQRHMEDVLALKSCSPEVAKHVVAKLRELAEDNSGIAAFVGDLYYKGNAGRRNYASAYKFYYEAWLTEPCVEVALKLFLGFHEKNFNKENQDVLFWLNIITDEYINFAGVVYLLGLLYSTGLYLKEDKAEAEKAFSIVQKAGLMCDPQADLKAWQCGAKSLRQCLKL